MPPLKHTRTECRLLCSLILRKISNALKPTKPAFLGELWRCLYPLSIPCPGNTLHKTDPPPRGVGGGHNVGRNEITTKEEIALLAKRRRCWFLSVSIAQMKRKRTLSHNKTRRVDKLFTLPVAAYEVHCIIHGVCRFCCLTKRNTGIPLSIKKKKKLLFFLRGGGGGEEEQEREQEK